MIKSRAGRSPRRLKVLLSAALAIALSGCVSTGQNHAPTPVAGLAAQPAGTEPASTPLSRQPAQPPVVTWSAGERDPERLLRMDRADLASTLGEPRYVRRDLTAEVWQYSLDGCILDVFLYPEAKEARVAYFEFRSRQLELAASDMCFESLLLHHKRDIEDS